MSKSRSFVFKENYNENNTSGLSHEFSSTKYGGQIKITALDENDNETTNQIRNLTRDVQSDFAEGNFTKPFFIHEQLVPGTDAMTKNKDQIQYKIQI